MLPTMNVASPAVAAVACVSMCVAAALVRFISAKKHLKRMEQLNRSEELFEYHARLLAAFLDDPMAPARLKQMAIMITDFMADREAVRQFAMWSSKQPVEAPIEDADTIEILCLIEDLRRERPELGRTFSSAIVCGVFGAMLRWPEAACLFDLTGPAVVADGNRQVAAAVRASKMISQPVFEMPRRQPAMA
jgi:hypothetical protein